jgi:hypothetical protein
MSSRIPDNFESGIGDITEVMSSQGVSDLSWLNVDEEMYREHEALPKQNLDIIPELQSALSWDGKDSRVPEITPLRPHAVVNRNPLDNPEATLRSNSSVPNRLAAYVIAGLPDSSIAGRLSLEFSPGQLSAAHREASEILGEKGLLGNVYVDSKHFPRCAQDGPHREFVAKSAKRALFVIQKQACGGCVCNKSGTCTSFKKRLTTEVPYDQKTAAHYVPKLVSENRVAPGELRAALAAGPSGVRSLLRTAFLRPVATKFESPQTIQHRAKPKAPVVTEADVRSFWDRRMASADAEAVPGTMYLVAARRMMQGKADPHSLVASADPSLRSLSREHGLLGHTYLDADALGGVHNALRHVQAHSENGLPDFVLLRNPTASDASSPDLAELMKLTSVVRKRPELGLPHLSSALDRAVSSGRITPEMAAAAARNAQLLSASQFPAFIAEVNLARPAVAAREVEVQTTIGTAVHHGDTSLERTVATMSPDEVRRTISHMMNTGLSGRRLQAAVLQRYSRADLAQVQDVGASLSREDGVQGHYFIDPTAYKDYGRGCKTGGDIFRKLNPVPNVLAASGCTGCRSQTHPGWCSRYAKTLIRQVPETVRSEAAERRRLPVVRETAPMTNPVTEFGLTASIDVDIAAPARSKPEISVSSQSVTD